MKCRFLPLLMLPLLGFAQTNSKVEVPMSGTTTSENKPLEIKRNTQFNMEEIKVRWKKAALENCTGAPCLVVTPVAPMVPGAPTSVTAIAGNTRATVSFTAPSSDGGSAITGYTVTSSPAPTVGPGTWTGTGSPITVTGLTNRVAYTFTVVATNAVGSSVASAALTGVTPFFACGNSTVHDIDNNAYPTVLIITRNNQCWTQTNLKVTKYNDGTAIQYIDGDYNSLWSSTMIGAYGADPNVSSFKDTYGYLYNWYAAVGINGGTSTKNICPDGWKVPNNADWSELESALGGSTVGGAKMKSTTSDWKFNSSLNNNSSGFTALPAGWRFNPGNFFNRGSNANFFSTDQPTDSSKGTTLELSDFNDNIFYRDDLKTMGFSIRCLKI